MRSDIYNVELPRGPIKECFYRGDFCHNPWCPHLTGCCGLFAAHGRFGIGARSAGRIASVCESPL
jgi:hypothetical protein